MARHKAKERKLQYAAAELIVERCLVQRDSLFTPGTPIWSADPLNDLYRRFVEQPDTSADSFEEKFERQLAGAPATTVQLAAELLYVHLLPGNSTGGPHKRKLINRVLGWSPTRPPVQIPPELDAALEEGFAAEGMAYKIHRPFLLQYLLEFLRKWWSLDDKDRSLALKDPWAFKEVARSVQVPRSQSQMEILLHIVHPESFEDIMSREHKRRIAEAFESLADGETEDVDRRLLTIRKRLTDREGRPISFYEPRILVVWQPEADPWGQFVKFAGLFHRLPSFDDWERNYKLRLAERAGPAIETLVRDGVGEPPQIQAAVEQIRRVMRSKDQNIVRWQDHEPFVKWCGEEMPVPHLAVTLIRDRSRPVAGRIRDFLEHVPKDVVKSPASRTTLASFFLFAEDPRNYVVFRARPFEWAYEQVDYPRPAADADEAARYEHALAFCDRFLHEAAQRGLKLRDRLDAQGLIWTLAKSEKGPPEGMSQKDWDDFVQYRGGKPRVIDEEEGGDEEIVGPGPGPVVDSDLVESDPVGRLVLRRKNVVLYGPPGTGKTHASLALAEKWRRSFGQDAVLQVTFHPTFAYEDFVEGFRPNAEGRFERRDGIFIQACDRAHADGRRQFLLIIDELNRGDVARLFGELITLIEADKRHAGVSRQLPYSRRELWVPPNLHLLGTMNTADRSISLLDVAIRRRFCFVEYRPDPLVINGSAAHHHEAGGIGIADLMDGINRRLLAVGIDRDRAVGHSHFLVAASEVRPHDVLRDRLRHDVMPLVEEYCYADRSLMRRVFGSLVTDDGRADEEVFADDAAFAAAIRSIAEGRDGFGGGGGGEDLPGGFDRPEDDLA